MTFRTRAVQGCFRGQRYGGLLLKTNLRESYGINSSQGYALTGTMQMVGVDFFNEGKHYAFCAIKLEGGQMLALDNVDKYHCRSEMRVDFEAVITMADPHRKISGTFAHEPFNLPHATLTKLAKVNGVPISNPAISSDMDSQISNIKRQLDAMILISDQHRRLALSSGISDLLVVRVKLQDDNTVDSYCNEACAQEYGWGTNSARVSYAQSSYNALDVSASTGVVKTVTLSTSISRYVNCTFDLLGDDAVAALTASGFSTSGFEVIQFYMPRNIGGCGFGGISYIGGTRSWVRQSGVGTMVHELGHSYGVWHAGTDPDNNGMQDTEYGDYSCVMGSPSNLVTMHGIHRMALGWIPANAITTMSCPSGCTQSFTIADLQQTPATTVANGQFTMLKTKRANRAGFYYLSYRAGTTGLDANLLSTYKNKVSLHYYNDGGNTEFITGLSIGQTYVDTMTISGTSMEMLRITVLSIASGVAVVSVTIPAPSSCTTVQVSMTDSYGDGWNGNSLFFTPDKSVSVSLGSGSSGTDSVCLPPGTYTPFACGGTWQAEVGWTIVGYGISGGATTTCAATSGSFTIVAQNNPTSSPTRPPTSQPTSSPVFAPTVSPTTPPTASPTSQPTPSPTSQPTSSPVFAPTVSPTTPQTTSGPTSQPTPSPTSQPTPSPTSQPTSSPIFSSLNPTPSPTVAPAPQVCRAPTEKVGDGVCNENSNVRECFWDGGDCCQLSCMANNKNKIRRNCGKKGYNCLDPAYQVHVWD